MPRIESRLLRIKSILVDPGEIVGVCEMKDETSGAPHCVIMLHNGKAIIAAVKLSEFSDLYSRHYQPKPAGKKDRDIR